MWRPTVCHLLTLRLMVHAVAGLAPPAANPRSSLALVLVSCLLQPTLSNALQQHAGAENCALPLVRCAEDLGNGLCRTTNDLCAADPATGLKGVETESSAGSKSGTRGANMACPQEACPNETDVLDPAPQTASSKRRRQPREKAHILTTLKKLAWLAKLLFPHRVLGAILGLGKTLVQFSFLTVWRALVGLSKIVICLLVVIWEDIIFPITFPARLMWWALIKKPIDFARLIYIKIRPLLVLLFSAMTVGGVIGMMGGFTHTLLANWLFPLHDVKVHEPPPLRLADGLKKTPVRSPAGRTPADSGMESPSDDSSVLGELEWPVASRSASVRSQSSYTSATKPHHATSSTRQRTPPSSSRSGTTNASRSRESSASSSSAQEEGSTLTTPSSKSSWVSIMKRNPTSSPSSSLTSGRKKVTFKTD